MVRTSSVARRQAGSLKKAIYKKKVEKKQLRYFRRQELSQHSLHKIAPVAVEVAPLSYTSSTDNTMRSIKSLTESFTPSDLTVSCQQSTDRFLAGLFSPSDYQKNIESSSSEEVDHNLGLLFPLSPIPEERTNQVDSDKEVVSFGNLFVSEQEKKPILPKTSDEVISLGHLFSETSENETSQSLGPLFSLPVTSEQEVVTFGNLFESEKESNQPIVSQTSDEVISFGHLFSQKSDKEITENMGQLFSLHSEEAKESVTARSHFTTSQFSEHETSFASSTYRSMTTEEFAHLHHLLATTPSDHSFMFLDEDDLANRLRVHTRTVDIRSEMSLASSTKSEETISIGHFFSEASDKESTQSLGPLFSSPMISEISEKDIVTFGNLFASENETRDPIITFPESSDESEASDDWFGFPSTKDSLELSYVQNLRVSETDIINSILSDEASIQALVRDRYQESSVLLTTSEDEEMTDENWNPRPRLTKKKTKDIGTRDRVAALEMEVDGLRDLVAIANNRAEALEMKVVLLTEVLRRQQNNTKTVNTQTEDVSPSVPVSSVRQRAAFFESKSDTTVNAKKREDVSKRETRTM